MTILVKDPLLAFARILLMVFIVILGIACAGVAGAVGAVLIMQPQIFARLAEQGIPASGELITAIALLLAAAAFVLGLSVYLLVLLRRIVNSVGEGDPFIPANADRLSRMGWVVVIAEIASIVVGVLAGWANHLAPNIAQNIDVDINPGGGGIVLILVLFILARVFRQGAAMREELEGTV